jgi:hypothetical protein
LRVKAAQADIAINYWNERGFARRDTNGRFLPLSDDIRRRGDEAEAALKAAKRDELYEISSAVLPGDVDQTGLLRPLTLW